MEKQCPAQSKRAANCDRSMFYYCAESLVKICHALGVSADYILFGKEEHGDLSTVNAMLSGLDPEYLPYVEEMLRSYIKAITAVKK